MRQLPRTRRSPLSPDICNLAAAIKLIGDRWTLLILRAALYGVRRFDDFQSELGTPRTVLSDRLKRLTNAGILVRRPYREQGRRARSEYLLSEAGEDLRPAMISLTQWGDKWLATADPPISFTSKTGSIVHAGFIDQAGNEVSAAEMRIVLRK